MVEVTFDQRLGAVNVSLLERQVLTHYLIGIAVTVCLVVGLVHHVDAPAVAEFIEILAVRIVRGAQEVNVGLLHQAYILFVGGIIDVATCQRMVVVTVHPAQLHVLSVNLEDLADNLHFLHAEVIVEVFDGVALVVFQFYAKGI